MCPVCPVQLLSAVLQQKASLLVWGLHPVGLVVTPNYLLHFHQPADTKLWKLAAWLLPAFLLNTVISCPLSSVLLSSSGLWSSTYLQLTSAAFNLPHCSLLTHLSLQLCALYQQHMTCISELSPSLCVEGAEGSVLRGALLFYLFLNHHHLGLRLSAMLHSAQVQRRHDQQPVGQLRQNLRSLIILASQWNTDTGLLCLFLICYDFSVSSMRGSSPYLRLGHLLWLLVHWNSLFPDDRHLGLPLLSLLFCCCSAPIYFFQLTFL